MDKYPVVTGATSGIGKAYADELAQRGLNVVLIGRSMDKLQTVAKEIEKKYGRQTHIIQVDFLVGSSIYPAIDKELQGLNIGILVVTGATSGIGKAYADELAQRGLNVVLIGRSMDKLQTVAKEIEKKYGRQTHIIQVDFLVGSSIYPAIDKELQGLNIGILVNNVGMTCSDDFEYFLEISDIEHAITHVINCNILSIPQMTRLVLPGMVERGTGLIINISSEMGTRPQPLVTLYSASKAFVTYFSQCLHAEYKPKGIHVQCVAPLLVSTNMTKNIKVNSLVKSAQAFAHEATNTVGYSSYTSGCLSHTLQSWVLTLLLPDWLRMSTFFISSLRKPTDTGQDKCACKKNESLNTKKK